MQNFKLFTELPIGISYASLIEDPNGGVLLVGGYSKSQDYLTTIFKLEHAGADQKWIEMEAKMQMGRIHISAIFIPDEIANCTLNKV